MSIGFKKNPIKNIGWTITILLYWTWKVDGLNSIANTEQRKLQIKFGEPVHIRVRQLTEGNVMKFITIGINYQQTFVAIEDCILTVIDAK